MRRINEFIENGKYLVTLDRELYLETAHLSSDSQIKETQSFKSLLKIGNELVPFIVNKILVENSILFRSYYILLNELLGDFILIDSKDKGIVPIIKEKLEIWWFKNKETYGG